MEKRIPRVSVLQSAVLFGIWEELGEDADSPTYFNYSTLAEKFARRVDSIASILLALWVKGIIERIPVERPPVGPANTHFGYYRSAIPSVEIDGWGTYDLEERPVPSALWQAQEEALASHIGLTL